VGSSYVFFVPCRNIKTGPSSVLNLRAPATRRWWGSDGSLNELPYSCITQYLAELRRISVRVGLSQSFSLFFSGAGMCLGSLPSHTGTTVSVSLRI
jgi:hypothetical protein